MNQCELAISIAQNNNGIITSRNADHNKIKRQVLSYLVKIGKLEKSSFGVYILPTTIDDEYFNIQSRFKRGVFSGISALFLLHLTDINPNQICLTFPNKYNYTGAAKNEINCINSKYYEKGIIEVSTVLNNKVKCYNAERTLCDILKMRKKIDASIINSAFKMYCKSRNKNIPLLLEYSSLFRVETLVKNYLEVLL